MTDRPKNFRLNIYVCASESNEPELIHYATPAVSRLKMSRMPGILTSYSESSEWISLSSFYPISFLSRPK